MDSKGRYERRGRRRSAFLAAPLWGRLLRALLGLQGQVVVFSSDLQAEGNASLLVSERRRAGV